ncbi:MAG: two pore domain potassium channel family protein [Actinotalea sp.]|nr:two pore domain potassium channel family protein [Actinotalea sp.]
MPGAMRRAESWWSGALNLLAVLLLYFAVPLDASRPTRDLALGIGLTVLAVGGVGAVTRREVRRVRTGGEGVLTPLRLVLLAQVVLVVFAFAYYVLATVVEGEITGITTRIDALYFSATTMTTVGYGDVHATGQAARVLVTTQLLFDIVFLGALAALFSRRLARPVAP